jgi:hypothetical protein
MQQRSSIGAGPVQNRTVVASTNAKASQRPPPSWYDEDDGDDESECDRNDDDEDDKMQNQDCSENSEIVLDEGAPSNRIL